MGFIRKLKCKLGYHHWKLHTVTNPNDGKQYYEIECKYCPAACEDITLLMEVCEFNSRIMAAKDGDMVRAPQIALIK